MMKERIEWIDILKGIAIILVVLGHMPYSECNDGIYHAIYSFHMAMFFILAGFTTSLSQKNKESGYFIRQKFYALCLPYIVWNFLVLPFPSVSECTSGYDMYERFIICVSGRCNNGGAYWFLLTLFALQCTYLLYAWSEKRIKNAFCRCAVLGILYMPIIMLHYLYGAGGNGFGLATQAYLFYIPFMVGVCMNKYPAVYRMMFSKWAFVVWVLLALYVPLLRKDLPNMGHIGRFAAIGITCILIKLTDNKKLFTPFLRDKLMLIGRYSLAIYIFHYAFVLKFNDGNTAFIASGNCLETLCVYVPIAVIICYLSIGIAKIIEQSEILSFWMLGKAKKRK